MRPLAVPWVAFLAAVVALAGCAEDGGDEDPAPSPTGAGTTSGTTTTGPPPLPPPVLQLLVFELTGCQGVSVQHNRPIDDVQALLPDGFTAAPAPGGNEAAGVLAVDLYLCTSLATATASVPDTYIGRVYTYVERPTERVPGTPDVPVHEYVFRMLAGEDVLAQLWTAAMYDTYSGAPEMNIIDQTAPARVSVGGIGPPDVGYSLYGTGAAIDALGGDRDQAFARYTVVPADNSVLLWTGTYDLPAVAIGPGTFQVPTDDPFMAYGQGREGFPGVATQVADGNLRSQVLTRVFTPA